MAGVGTIPLVILAELVLRHTRQSSPTRRVAVERFAHPEDSAMRAPGLLLGGVVVAHLPLLDASLYERYGTLLDELGRGMGMPARALRYRVQTDIIGLDRSQHRLSLSGEQAILEIDRHGPSTPQVVGALTAVSSLRGQRRRSAISLMRKARSVEWTTPAEVLDALMAGADPELLSVRRQEGITREEERALEVLGFGLWERPTRTQVLAAFRRTARGIHPDHGAESEGAGARMAELAQARRLLLAAE